VPVPLYPNPLTSYSVVPFNPIAEYKESVVAGIHGVDISPNSTFGCQNVKSYSFDTPDANIVNYKLWLPSPVASRTTFLHSPALTGTEDDKPLNAMFIALVE